MRYKRVSRPKEKTVTKNNGTRRSFANLAALFVLLALCAGLGACATTQAQVRGQYDVAVGTVRR